MDSQGILNRLMTAYGVTSQKSLAEALAIPANNISGWLQRGSVPGNPIIKCALDTGTDLRWLVTGKFANANIGHKVLKNVPSRYEKGKALIEKMLSTGGKAVLQRVMEAYGFNTQKELSEYLAISTGTISTWVRREYFPGDVVITCALDTGASLEWLATGKRVESTDEAITLPELPIISQKTLLAGKLIDFVSIYNKIYSSLLGKAFLLLCFSLCTNFSVAISGLVINDITGVAPTNFPHTMVLLSIAIIPFLTILVMGLYI